MKIFVENQEKFVKIGKILMKIRENRQNSSVFQIRKIGNLWPLWKEKETLF